MDKRKGGKFLLGVCNSKAELIKAVNALVWSGFIYSDIAILLPPKDKEKSAFEMQDNPRPSKRKFSNYCSGIPLTVHVSDNFTAASAKAVLEGSGVHDICVLGETSPS